MNFIIRLLITAAVAYGLTYVLSGVHFTSFQAAIIFAVVFAILNAIVKPILTILTLPVTIVTLGLFLFVINAIVILLAAKLTPGFVVGGFFPALIGSVVLTLITSGLTMLVGKRR